MFGNSHARSAVRCARVASERRRLDIACHFCNCQCSLHPCKSSRTLYKEHWWREVLWNELMAMSGSSLTWHHGPNATSVSSCEHTHVIHVQCAHISICIHRRLLRGQSALKCMFILRSTMIGYFKVNATWIVGSCWCQLTDTHYLVRAPCRREIAWNALQGALMT